MFHSSLSVHQEASVVSFPTVQAIQILCSYHNSRFLYRCLADTRLCGFEFCETSCSYPAFPFRVLPAVSITPQNAARSDLRISRCACKRFCFRYPVRIYVCEDGRFWQPTLRHLHLYVPVYFRISHHTSLTLSRVTNDRVLMPGARPLEQIDATAQRSAMGPCGLTGLSILLGCFP